VAASTNGYGLVLASDVAATVGQVGARVAISPVVLTIAAAFGWSKAQIGLGPRVDADGVARVGRQPRHGVLADTAGRSVAVGVMVALPGPAVGLLVLDRVHEAGR
jgi:hypothetical protein